MRLEAKKYLHDILTAAGLIGAFTESKRFSDYAHNVMLRSAVERQFEKIGEALSQLARVDDELVGRVSEHRRIIAFRNILIHAYTDVDDRVVWDVIESKLPQLREEVEALLTEG